MKIGIVGLSSNRDLCWVPLERLRKAVKSFTRSLPKAGERAEAAEVVDGGHHVWYCGKITADSKFAVECAVNNVVHCSTLFVPVLNTKTLILRYPPDANRLSFEEAVSMIDCSSPPSKLISMFSAHSKDESVPHELQFITYPDDQQQQLGSTTHGGTSVDLDVFADSFTLAEARELSGMVSRPWPQRHGELSAAAEPFAAHYAALPADLAPPSRDSAPELHLHWAHVRAPPASFALTA